MNRYTGEEIKHIHLSLSLSPPMSSLEFFRFTWQNVSARKGLVWLVTSSVCSLVDWQERFKKVIGFVEFRTWNLLGRVKILLPSDRKYESRGSLISFVFQTRRFRHGLLSNIHHTPTIRLFCSGLCSELIEKQLLWPEEKWKQKGADLRNYHSFYEEPRPRAVIKI